MSSEYDVAVVGATGAVGEVMISILEERDFPVRNLYPLASSRSAGKTVMFRGKSVTVTDLAEFDFSQAQIGLFSAGGSVSEKYAPIAAEAGWWPSRQCTNRRRVGHRPGGWHRPPPVGGDAVAGGRSAR